MPDVSPTAERPIAPNETQVVPNVNPDIGPDISAKKRHNFIYNLLHRKKKESADVPKEPVESAVEPVSVAPAEAADKRAEMEGKIAEVGKEGGLRVALEGRLETWHTEINRWLIKTENVPSPMSVRERLNEIARGAFDPSGQDNMPEDFKRQAVDVARVNLRVAAKLVTSIRLRLGGPYSKGGQNGSDN